MLLIPSNPFILQVFDWDANLKHDFIGLCDVTIREMQVMKEISLRNPRRIGFTSTAGVLIVNRLEPAPVGAVGVVATPVVPQ